MVHTHTHTHTHTHNGILLSHKKEQMWVSEVDEPRACYAEWSKSEREKQILYNSAYTWNSEKLYWWTCFESRSIDADIDLWGIVGEGGTLRG